MRPIAWTFLLVAAAGCASTSSAPDLGPSSPTTTAMAQSGGSRAAGVTVSVQNTSVAQRAVIAAPMEKTWEALDKAYAALAIAPSERNATTHSIGNTSFKARRKLGDIQLRKALDCGGDTSAPNAESYEITMSVRSQLSPDPSGGVLLQTFVEGIGKNALTNSGNQVPCYSSGGIETRIADLVRSGTGLTMPVIPKKGG
jgi:hypothetical protein